MGIFSGMTDAFVWDAGTSLERSCDHDETDKLLVEIDNVFREKCAHLAYHHKWVEGDFLIADNLALGHEASPETQAPLEDVGLRIMHRTTVQGTEKPSKKYRVDHEGNVIQN